VVTKSELTSGGRNGSTKGKPRSIALFMRTVVEAMKAFWAAVTAAAWAAKAAVSASAAVGREMDIGIRLAIGKGL
jgi:hypothetical protein